MKELCVVSDPTESEHEVPADEKPPGASEWYSAGLKFHCTQCGNCCTGTPGYVWLSTQEMIEIAEFLNISTGELRLMHTKVAQGKLSLADHANGDCVFLDRATRKCRIYPVRPAQCRTWPFWEKTIETPEAWQATCEVCPGAGKGELVPLEMIRKSARQSRL